LPARSASKGIPRWRCGLAKTVHLENNNNLDEPKNKQF
jgi:hypothetical protein